MTDAAEVPINTRQVLDVPDLRNRLTPITAHNLLYHILKFRKYIHMDESEVWVGLTPLDDEAGYFELIRRIDGEVMEWAYLDIHKC